MELKTSTTKAFRNALRFSKPEHRDLVQINCARMLTKLGDHEQAIKMYKDVKEATFNSGSGLAYALFKSMYEMRKKEKFKVCINIYKNVFILIKIIFFFVNIYI